MVGIHRQQYYRSIKKAKAKEELAQQVIDLVSDIRVKMPRLGTRKLYYLLEDPLRKLRVGRDKLFTILKANHLLIKPKRQYHVTTNSHHRFKKHKNSIEHLEINRPEQVFVSDITYLGDRAYPMYLALVTDAYSKKIMGFDVSDSLNAQGAVKALNMATKNRKYPNAKLIHHSDRGLQYCSNEYQEILQKHGIKCSMTEKYDPYQNAIAERINGILKQEFIGDIKVQTVKMMSDLIKNSVYVYNTFRPHFSNYYLTPEKMHHQRELSPRKYLNKKMSTNYS